MKTRFLWLSDTHLNRIPHTLREGSMSQFIRKSGVRNVVITGDITTGTWLRQDLLWLSRTHPRHRFHVVLGNHDYHGISFREAHRVAGDVAVERTNMNWLSAGGITSLPGSVALVGHEGWFCGTAGVQPWWLSWSLDAFRISELAWTRKKGLVASLDAYRSMAERSVEAVCNSVGQAIKNHDQVVVATHFPPWALATPNDVNGYVGSRWINYDTNHLLGMALEQIANENPSKRFLVLAGHTHAPKTLEIAHNLTCKVAPSTVGETILKSIVEV